MTSEPETSHPPPSGSSPTPWGLVTLLGALTGMGPVAIDMYLPSLPAIGADLNASAGQTQGTVSAFLIGMAIGQFFYGPASDRLGRRAPILLGVVIFIVGSVMCALAASPELLLIGRFIQALGACAGGVVSRAVIRDRFDHTETARVLSLMMLIMGLAPILAPLIGGWLLVFGWRVNFWFMAAFGIAVGVAGFLRLKESRTDETVQQAAAENALQAYRALMGQRRLIGYALAGSLNGAVLFTYIASSPDLLIGTYGIAASAFGWIFGLNAVGIIGTNQVNRWLLRRVSPDQVLATASLVATGFGVLLALAAVSGVGERWSVLPILFLLLSSFGFMQGNTMAGALSVDPKRAGSISALMGGASFATGALASSLAGLLHDGTPRPMALVMLGALAGSALTLRYMALPRSSPSA